MSQTTAARWLVTYDIANPRRLTRVFKTLKKEGIPIQYSVFCVDASALQIEALMARLALLIDKNADDVRAYRIPENTWQVRIGKAMLPQHFLPGAGYLFGVGEGDGD